MDMDISSVGGNGLEDTRSDARLKEVENIKHEEICSVEPSGHPDGFQFVLPFLDLPSRLNVERVSKSLRQALKDPLVWVDLRIGERACGRLTSEILLKLVERADGHLKGLFLVDALQITDVSLSKIFEVNPGLERISVLGCVRLDVDKFVSLVEAHSLTARVKGLPGISQVHLAGLYNILPQHLLRLKNALGVSSSPQKESSQSRRYYGNLEVDNGATDKLPVDVELCPNCKNVRLIYDCTSYERLKEEEGCSDDVLGEDDDSEVIWDDGCLGKYCRSCLGCIPRCDECGTCIKTDPFTESLLCSHLLCDDCRDDDLPRCYDCGRYACLRDEESCFPSGVKGLCYECIEGNIEYLECGGPQMIERLISQESGSDDDFDAGFYMDYYSL